MTVKPPPLNIAIDVPSLEAGTNAWTNIQPLLRHSFLNVTNYVTHLETLVEDQQNTIENVAELQRRDMSSLTEHLQSVISTYTQPLVEKVSAMERQVTGLQIENKNLRQKQLQLEQKMGEMEATPAPRQDLTPITGKIVKLESHFIAISKRIDALSNSFDNHLFSRKSREREEVDKEAIEGGTGSSVNIRNELKMIRDELSFKCDGAFVKGTLEGKANKQSVADALHKKANKATVAKEIGLLKTFLRESVHDINAKVDSKAQLHKLPIETISQSLTQIAREVRTGVAESRRSISEVEGRLGELEEERWRSGGRRVMGGGHYMDRDQNLHQQEQNEQIYPSSNISSPRHSVVSASNNNINASSTATENFQNIHQLKTAVASIDERIKTGENGSVSGGRGEISGGVGVGARSRVGGGVNDSTKSKVSLLNNTGRTVTRRHSTYK